MKPSDLVDCLPVNPDFEKHATSASLRRFQAAVMRLLAGATVLASLFLVGCASTPENESTANKVWMRDGSTANSEFAENACRAAATTDADFTLCMMSDGWKLQTPPSP